VTQSTAATHTAQRSSPLSGLLGLRTYGLVLGIIVLAVFFWLQNPAFASPNNLVQLLRSMASLAMISFAQLLVIISAELDLSVGSVYGLTATALAVLWLGAGNSPFEPLHFAGALVMALAIALACGATNAFFTTVVGIPSFIATLGMLSMASGFELLLSNAGSFNAAYHVPQPDPGQLEAFRSLGFTTLPIDMTWPFAVNVDIPIQAFFWLPLAFVAFWVIRHRTIFGFRLLAIGGNADAARVTRLPVRRYKFVVFMLCAFMAGLAGVLDFSFVGSIGPNSGAALTFPVFAAVVIGGASLTGGRGSVFGTLMGAVLLAVIANGLAIMGVPSFVRLVFIGAVTIGAVSLDVITQRAARRAEMSAR
jgi:ribose/xylose/arabinose/galactoside ABC-type transport system permease subunit